MVEFTFETQHELFETENDFRHRHQTRVDQFPTVVLADNVPPLEQALKPRLFDQFVIVNRSQLLVSDEAPAVVALLEDADAD